jgi:hypothetical protein
VGLLVPYAAGIATAIALWGDRAPRIFFETRRRGLARATLLISAGTGLGFAFGALGRADGGGDPHLALTAGALAMGAAGVAIQAIFGYDGTEDS